MTIEQLKQRILEVPDFPKPGIGFKDLTPLVLDAASRFERRPADAEMAAMLGATRMTSLFGLAT